MSSIILYKVAIDWLTLTSYRDELYQAGEILMESVGNEWTESHLMQYSGKKMDMVGGHIFVGTGLQKMSRHHMIRISGEAAHNATPYLAGKFQPYQDRISRIDAQITIDEPEKWSQWDLCCRLRSAGYNVGWIASRDKETGYELATVYIGNRAASPRYVRIYQKLTDEGKKVLRLEVEIKRKRAREHGKNLAEYGRGDVSKLRDELAHVSQSDPKLHLAYSSALEGWKKPIRVGAQETNTGGWIIGQCLPAIGKYLNSHSSNQTAYIVAQMKEIIRRNEL